MPSNFDPFGASYSTRPASSSSSTHPMLPGTIVDTTPLSSSLHSATPLSPTSTSLSVNYIPSKFSHALLTGTGPYRRKGKGNGAIPKMGGGVDAFKSGEARIGGRFDDEDGARMGSYGQKTQIQRWTKFKWILFFANIALTCYSIVALIACLLIWFNVFQHSTVIMTADKPVLITSTVAASLGILTSTIGWAGILLNNRLFLAIYTFLLWIVFGALVIPGYLSYKRRTFNLEGKLNAQWSRDLGTAGRLLLQNELQCCGYYNPFVEATVSATCYSRSMLPGCKGIFLQFERFVLARWYTGVFGLVPLHIFVMIAGLLCSNHVTYRFGKGMTPKAYRLDMNTVATLMDNYANELAELYGTEVAEDVLKKSRSNLNLASLSSMSYTPALGSSPKRPSRAKYESISIRSPDGA